MNILFCHDHVFSQFQGQYFSPGKLTYDKLAFYRDLSSRLTIAGRVKNVSSVDEKLELTTGHGVDFAPTPNLSSPLIIFRKQKVYRQLASLISKADAVICRIPSEIGLAAYWIARAKGKPVLLEVVASAAECLRYRGDFAAKIYAPILEARVARACASSEYVAYVTRAYLQKQYPTQGLIGAFSDVEIDEVAPPKSFSGNNPIVVGTIGNPDLNLKGIKYGMEGVRQARHLMNKDIRYHVLGGTGVNFILRNGRLPEWVKFEKPLSSQAEVFRWIESLDLYMQPSLTEGLPRALIEAMSRAVPSIGSNVGGIPELLSENALFLPGKVDGISRSIINALSPHTNRFLSEHSARVASQFLKRRIFEARQNYYLSFLGHASVKAVGTKMQT